MQSRREEQRLRRVAAAAREEERAHWARELHDETLQSLAVLRLQLSAARRASDADALRAALDGAVEGLGLEIASLRALITELRPAALDELGLAPALESLCERTASVHGIEVRTELAVGGRPGERLDPDLEIAVYRVVQEALTNAAKHGHAVRVEVVVCERDRELELSVRDDGRGFDPAGATKGFGLRSMRERIELAGGRLRVGSSRQGTEVAARIPLAHAAHTRLSSRLAS
jgi:signal transduction histidine kinase